MDSTPSGNESNILAARRGFIGFNEKKETDSKEQLQRLNTQVKDMKKVTLKLIRFYQQNISPRHISCCRFVPTCSAYCYEAIEKYGFIKGAYLGCKRLLRCNPFCKGGYDPVP